MPCAHIGIGVKTYDHMNSVNNWNGVYSIALFESDSIKFEFNTKQLAFKEARYINAHLDYEDQITKKSYFNKCFRMPGNQLSNYKNIENEGIIELEAAASRKIDIEVKDIENNATTLSFWLKYQPKELNQLSYSNYYELLFAEENLIQTPSMEAYFKENTFYENIAFSI